MHARQTNASDARNPHDPAPLAVVIVAAGMARRMGLNTPKPYLILGSKPVLQHAIDVFVAHPHVQWVQVVIHPDHQALYAAAIHPHPKLLAPIHGGAERADSVCRGLEALLPYAPQNVLIHDAARPAVSTGLIDRVLATLESADAVMPVIPVADTLRRKTDAGWSDISRADAVQVQTPQGFNFTHILEAHRTISVDSATLTDAPPTDDIAIFSLAYPEQNVQEVMGEICNRKLTEWSDVEAMTLAQQKLPRVGMGFDVHRFSDAPREGGVPENTVRLGGMDIPHSAGLLGHSDADVVLHALVDALLGTIADADIGAHFSPNDMRYENANSALFLKDAHRRVTDAGGVIHHLDITILCEAPKIAPYRDAMRARIAELLKITLPHVSVKATTTEGLGFTGRREGIAAQAVATVLFPEIRSESAVV